ncbi:MAG: SH3 domain-containing protein [Chloroflexi bacterium]|nr:SH3 domain-containing protein [Chloroflexota bacterium]
MHDNLDYIIKSRQTTGDDIIDQLNSTRPVGSTTHQGELGKRLLAQLQSNNERFNNMQAVHTGNIISFRKFPAILAAALTFLIIGGTLMLFNLPDGSPLNGGASQQRGSATPTPFEGNSCEPDHLRQIDLHVPVEVYAESDETSEVLGTFDAGSSIEVLGARGDWIALISGDEGRLGWIDFGALSESDYTIQVCTELPNVIVEAELGEACDVHFLRLITFHVPVEVYALNDETSEVLGTAEIRSMINVPGANREGDWIVVVWEDGVVGWIHFATLSEDDYTILACGQDIPPMPATGENKPPIPASPIAAPGNVINAVGGLPRIVETTEELSIYARDNAESEVLRLLEAGDTVEVLGQNFAGNWLVVGLDNGYAGWISLDDKDKFIVIEQWIYPHSQPGEEPPTAVPPTVEAPANQ